MKNKLFVIKDEKSLGYEERLKLKITEYKYKSIENGKLKIENHRTNYFLENDIWGINDLTYIKTFEENEEAKKESIKNINFSGLQEELRLQLKAVYFNQITNEKWTLKTVYSERNHHLTKLKEFLIEKYPNIKNIEGLKDDKINMHWEIWLLEKGIKTEKEYVKKIDGVKRKAKSNIATYIEVMIRFYEEMMDTRKEWEKDYWNVKNLKEYGIYYNETLSTKGINFDLFDNNEHKEKVKRYIKERLIKNNNFTWATAKSYVKDLADFYNYMYGKGIKIENIERQNFIEYQTEIRKQIGDSDNIESRFNRIISKITRYLEDIKTMGWEDSPKKDIQQLVYTNDKMRKKTRSKDNIKYIPDYVLDQLVANLKQLKEEEQAIILIMMNTGLRVSDVLRLGQDCLVKTNGKYWIKTDIEKTYVKDHRIPIDEKIANVVTVMIEKSKEKTTILNNPKKYIFCNFEGKRAGEPITQRIISNNLNYLAKENNIVDEKGSIWKFKNHSFRHTYAVKLINSGVSIIVVQDLLAHSSPEMTMNYARLVDDTKRKEWEKAYNSGAFQFDEDGGKVEIKLEEMAAKEGLEWEWIRHNMDAVKVSHGLCFVNAKQGCKYQVNPCLNANGGKPCRHLAVTPDFAPMYEFDIEMKKKIIKEGKERGEEYKHWVEKNEKELGRIEEIYEIIKNGDTFFQKKGGTCGKGDQVCPLSENK